MILKTFNVAMAYLIAVIFCAVCVALTYFLPQKASGVEVDTKLIVDMITVVSVSIIIFSSPLVLILGLFAFFKKIDSKYYYMVCGLCVRLLTLFFLPGLLGVKGDEASLWVPFVGMIAAACSGYIFWFLTIRRPKPKAQQPSE